MLQLEYKQKKNGTKETKKKETIDETKKIEIQELKEFSPLVKANILKEDIEKIC